MREAWTHMAAGSPNAARDTSVVIYRTSGNTALASELQHRLDLACPDDSMERVTRIERA